MSRRSLLYLLAVGFLAVGVYLGLTQDSPDDHESRVTRLKVRNQSVEPEASKSRLALRRASLEKHNQGVALNTRVLGGSDAQKRDGPIPEEDDVYPLIDEALHAAKPEDRASAVSELGLLDSTPEILFACLDALKDPDEDVRVDAVLALEMLEELTVIPVLQRVTERDPSEEVRETAAEAIESLMNP